MSTDESAQPGATALLTGLMGFGVAAAAAGVRVVSAGRERSYTGAARQLVTAP